MRVLHFSPVRQADRSKPVRIRRTGWLAWLAILAGVLLGSILPSAAGAAGMGSSLAEPPLTEPLTEPVVAQRASVVGLGYSLTPSTTEPYTPCPPGSGKIECDLIIDPPSVKTSSGYELPGGGPLLEGGGEKGGYDPKDLQSAYSIPTSGGSGETVALIDAYGYASAEADLAKYREKYGLAACTKASGCFKQVNEKGEEKSYPEEGKALENEWSLETALDMDMVSAACPSCKIMLVEATTQKPVDTAASAEEAAKLGATEISNSYGYPENSETWCPSKKGCSEYIADYNHAGIPVTVSSGDSGYDDYYDGVGAPNWPATSPNVIAVGGTNLKKAEGSRGWSETVWEGSGSGCSGYESKPEWQHDPLCPEKRMDNDVAAVASPETPVSVYNMPYAKGWINVGGTSVAAPLVAGVEAHTSSTVKKEGAEAFYRHTLFGVTSGSNGVCHHTYLCEGEEGYNGPTGWGTPDGPLELTPKTSAITEEATTAAATEATLNGYIYTTGLSTSYHFEYGPTTSYGTSVPAPNGKVGAGATWQAASQSISNLHALQGTYHYRLVATNSSGTVYGADHTFTTIPWAVEATPDPSGAEESTLDGVSCSSSTACTAVSSYYSETEATRLALIEDWNGTEWKIQATPKPSGAKSVALSGVSCTSSTACSAVGYYINSSEVQVTLAERWNGTEWTVQSTANPTGATASGLDGVSCTSSSACTAVGFYKSSSGSDVTLAEFWNGTEWSLQSTPTLTGAKSSSFSNVSCISSTGCAAVGLYTDSSEVLATLAERWNGTEWVIQTTPNPTGASFADLGSVSCTSSTACTAVGDYYVENKGMSLAERWNGTEWSIQTTPNPKGNESRLLGVSCVSSSECIAVGRSGPPALSERWNGSEWAVEPIATPEDAPGFEEASLSDISCLSSKVCVAVGRHIGHLEKGIDGFNDTLAASRAIPKPYVETTEAASIGETGATLNGVVNPESSETKYYFEYGTTESYGSKTAEASAGSGESNVEETKAVTGLTLGTTYDFRIVATNGGGTTHGANHKFTAAGKPSVETKAATSTGETEATLNGSVNPKAAETKYYFEYGTTEAYGSKTVEASAGSGINNLEESKVITGLVAGTTYHFRIVATNSHGTTDGSDRVFSTRGRPSVETKPATSVGEKEATLTGTVNPRGTETKYYFEYGTTEAYGSKTAEASAGSGESNVEESKTITGLAASTTYYFRIVATNSHGTVDGSNQVFSTTGKPTVETKPATGVNETGATFNGIANSRGAETKYHFEYGTTESYGTKTAEVSAGSGITNLEESKVIAGLEGGVTYHFRIVATNSHGTTDGAGQMFTTTTSPSWRVTPTPNPTGETQSSLEGTTCTSLTACTAVGYYKNDSGARLALAEAWNSEEWKEQATSKPTGATETELDAVSCTSSSACTAVGSYLDSSGVGVPLAERWNGEAWSVQEPPSPTGAKESGLFGVSCASSSACTGVGAYINSAGAYTALAENWNGTSWSIKEPPNPAGAKQSQLLGVSCTSSTACTAVGEYENSEGTAWLAQAESWNGEGWSLQEPPSPTGARNTWPEGVACTSSSTCTAVGYFAPSTGGRRTLAEVWNGKAWSVQSTPIPTEAPNSNLRQVSCTLSTACTAVGHYSPKEGEVGEATLAEQWNGTEWAIQSSPNPTGAPTNRLLGVSCTSATACTAVGYYDKSKSEESRVTLAEIYG